MRRNILVGATILAALLFTSGAAQAKSLKFYGSWSEAVGRSSGNNGSVEYMANLTFAVRGQQVMMKQSYNGETVARLSGKITSRSNAAGKETLEVTFRPRRLAKTFATSTGSLVDSFLVNTYHLPGGDVSLGTASAELKARVQISGGGKQINVQWKGVVDKYTPNVKAAGWQRGLRGRATHMMKDYIDQQARPLIVKGSFHSI